MTRTQIANLALTKIGETQIASIDDPNEKTARTIKSLFDQTLEEVLRVHFWGFAMTARALVAEETSVGLPAELDGWENAFALPADYLRLEKVTSGGEKIDLFRIQRANGKRCLLANVDALTLHYVARVTDTAEFDPLFVQAFATLLAARLARGITGSEQLETQLMQRYETVDLPNARTANGQDSQSNENHPLAEIIAGSLTGNRSGYFGPAVIAEIDPDDE